MTERYAAGPQHWQDYRRRLGPASDVRLDWPCAATREASGWCVPHDAHWLAERAVCQRLVLARRADDKARALLASASNEAEVPAAPPADDGTPYQSPDLHTGTEHSDRVLTDDK